MNSAPTPKKKQALACFMIALGLMAVYIGALAIPEIWSYGTLEAKICFGLIVFSGVLLLAAGLARLLITRHRRAASTVGAAAAGIFVLTWVAGLFSGVIPCTSPG